MTKDKTVTMSRELAEDLLALATSHNTSDWSSELCGALRALLAAPVVERQEPDYQLPAHARGDKWYGFGYCDFSSGEDKSRLIDYLKDLLDDVPEEPLYTSPPAPVAVVLPTREVMRDLIAEVIGGDAYDCTRVWSAWSVGTMSEDDFVPLTDSEERLYELADACLDKVKELNK